MDSSNEYTVEYKFTADVKGLEQGVKEVKSLVKDAADEVGDNFKVNWGEGSGNIEDYTKWLENASKETENLASATSDWSLTAEEQESITQRNAEYMQQYNAKLEELSQGTRQAKDDMSGFDSALYSTAASVGELDTKTQALLVAITALEAKFLKDSLDSFAQYEDAVYGMAATVANVGGTIEQAMGSIQEVTANGLLSETDAARAINNLTAYGYSVEEATRLIEAMTVSVEAHGNRSNTVSENVVQLTEAIKRQSSQMLKTQGYSETLSQAQDRYAQSIGTTSDKLTDSEQRQAEYNALIQDSLSYMGLADAYNNSYSASVQRLSNSLDDLKVIFGQIIAPLVSWLADVATWIVQNKELVVTVGTFIGVLAGSGGLIVALVKVVHAIGTAVGWFLSLDVAAKGLVIGLATVATALAVVAATSNLLTKSLSGLNVETEENEESAEKGAEGFENLGGAIGGVGGAARDTTKQLEKLRRQYLDELKQIETRHKETIGRLTKQIQDANVDYRRAIDERNAEFAVSQAKEEKKHQEKVDELMTQIDFLQRYNNEYNRQKLTNLQLALARENHLYQQQTKAAKEELELQNENDRVAYEEKRAQLQSELDDELAFMNKHRDELRAVQDWIIEDEIEALNRRYEEQKESYAMQAEQASIGGASIGTNLGKSIKETLEDEMDKMKFDLGESAFDLGKIFGDTFVGKAFAITDEFFNGMLKTVQDILGWVVDRAKEIYNTTKSSYEYQRARQAAGGGGGGDGWAMGGFTGRGGVNEVAGVVHKGEYVLPQEMVDQNTGLPKSMGTTVININLSGTFATSAAERRKVADQIVAAINQNNKSRLEASWQ